MSLAAFYRHKAVLVTGHTGFKGTWLATWLQLLGARVTGFSLPPDADVGKRYPPPGEARATSDAEKGTGPVISGGLSPFRPVVSRYGDVGKLAAVQAVFAECQPEIVFHLAAQALVRRSYRKPVDTYMTNVMGTVHVLEATRHTPSVRAVVAVTSDKCYENREWLWPYRETEPLGGHDPYSSSKACAELVTAAYRRSFAAAEPRPAIASARAGNVIGGGDWSEDRVVPDAVRALLTGEALEVRRPNAVRPWQHVLDPLRGYLMLGERLYRCGPEFAEAWNFGPAETAPVTVYELADRLFRVWGSGRIVVQPDAALHEAQQLRLDWSKARQRLGWHPLLTIDDAVRLTAEWYRAYSHDPAAATRLTLDQLHEYMSRLPASAT